MRERGDTLVEVLIATAILGAAVVAGLGAMNYGFGLILNAIERTQVQASVNSQLALVQYARDEYLRAQRDPAGSLGAGIWQQIVDRTATGYNQGVCTANAAPATDDAANKPFYINDQGTALVPAPPAAATATPFAGQGLWVEAVKSADPAVARSNYIDIYVKACWKPIVGNTNQEARTVMRLYAPQ